MEKNSINPLRLGLMIVLFLLIAGSLLYRFWPTGYTEPVSASTLRAAQMQGLDPYAFHTMLREPGFDGVVLDVRDLTAFNKEHLPKAIHIPMEQLLHRKSIKQLKKGAVYVYADKEEIAHEAALILGMKGIDATPLNGNFQILSAARHETGNAPLMFFNKEKIQYNFPVYFKALEPEKVQPVEIKVPLPKPTGC
jgi:rhodanese-related sulfurtransferase